MQFTEPRISARRHPRRVVELALVAILWGWGCDRPPDAVAPDQGATPPPVAPARTVAPAAAPEATGPQPTQGLRQSEPVPADGLEERPFGASPGDMYYRDALRARAQNDTAYALEMAREAVRSDPEHVPAWELMFELARQTEDPVAVAEACAGLLENRRFVGWQAGQLNLDCALVHRQIGQLDRAEQFARRSVEFGDYRLEPLITLSGILLEAQRSDAAIEVLEGRIRVPGGDLEASALSNLGIAYTRAERYDEAIATFELALAQVANRSDIEISYADALHSAGRDAEAIERLERVVERDSSNPAAVQRLEAWRDN